MMLEVSDYLDIAMVHVVGRQRELENKTPCSETLALDSHT
jgi:hypothetical protein